MNRQQMQLDPNSCLNRAAPDEPLFLLRAHDIASSNTVRSWIKERLATGKNNPGDPQILDAERIAAEMDAWRDGEKTPTDAHGLSA